MGVLCWFCRCRGSGCCGRSWFCRCLGREMSRDVLMTRVELGLSIADALMDNRKTRLGPRNEIRGS
jgi:hypothetical protein